MLAKVILSFLQGALEITGEIAFGLALAGIPFRWNIMALTGSVFTIIILVVRSLNLTFGLHTVLLVVLLTLFYALTTRLVPSTCLLISFCSVAVLITLELAVHELFFSVVKLPLDYVLSNHYLWVLLGMPQAVIMIALAVLISRLRKNKENGWKI